MRHSVWVYSLVNTGLTPLVFVRLTRTVGQTDVCVCPFRWSSTDTAYVGLQRTGCPIKNDPLCCFAKISIISGTFSAKFYAHVYSTKIHMLTIFGVQLKSIQSMYIFCQNSTGVVFIGHPVYNIKYEPK